MRKNQSKFFILCEENLKFLRVFQIFGFLPLKLKSGEKNFAIYSTIILILFLFALIVLRFNLVYSELILEIFFLFDIFTIFVGFLSFFFTKNRCKKILKLISEIDIKIINELQMGKELKLNNIKMQKKLAITWLIYGLLNFHYILSKIIVGNFSTIFFDSLFRIVTWGILVNINITKYLYFFSLLSVRLEVVKICLKKIQNEEKCGKIF